MALLGETQMILEFAIATKCLIGGNVNDFDKSVKTNLFPQYINVFHLLVDCKGLSSTFCLQADGDR